MIKKVVKCQGGNCSKPATWRMGTWNVCDDCILYFAHDVKKYIGGEMFFTGFGTTRRVGLMDPWDDYKRIPEPTVEVDVTF